MASTAASMPMASLLRSGILGSSPSAMVAASLQRRLQLPLATRLARASPLFGSWTRTDHNRMPAQFFRKTGATLNATSLSRRTFFSPARLDHRTPAAGQIRSASSKVEDADAERERREKEEDEADAREYSKKTKWSDRLKFLMKKYGRAAVGVYLFYSAIDFGLVFLAISMVGADKVRQAEDWFLEKVDWKAYTQGWSEEKLAKIPGVLDQVGNRIHEYSEKHHADTKEALAQAHKAEQGQKQSGSSTVWTTAILAYSIHKVLLLPFRIALTAGTLPQIVRLLQRWGWNVGRSGQASTGAAGLLYMKQEPQRRRHGVE